MKMQERDLKERARRLGYKLKRRGKDYSLIGDDGAVCGSHSIESMNWQLDVIEYKIPLQISTACGVPLFKINDDG
jgi:hypothetical protein